MSPSLTILTDRDAVLRYLDTPRAASLHAQRLATLGEPTAYAMTVRDAIPGCRFADDVADAVRRAREARPQGRIRRVRRAA